MDEFVTTYGLITAYILTGAGVVLAIVFPIINAISNPKQLLGAAVGVAVLVALFFIGYALSDSELTSKFAESGVESENLSQIIGGMLIMVYIMVGIVVVGITYTELHKAVK